MVERESLPDGEVYDFAGVLERVLRVTAAVCSGCNEAERDL